MKVLQRKALIGPIISIIGGIFLLIAGIRDLSGMIELHTSLIKSNLTFEEMGLSTTVINTYINDGLTLVWGILAVVGSVLTIGGKSYGMFILLIVGIISSIGLFYIIQPAQWIDTGFEIHLFNDIQLNSSLFYVDPFLVLFGGILTIVLTAKS